MCGSVASLGSPATRTFVMASVAEGSMAPAGRSIDELLGEQKPSMLSRVRDLVTLVTDQRRHLRGWNEFLAVPQLPKTVDTVASRLWHNVRLWSTETKTPNRLGV